MLTIRTLRVIFVSLLGAFFAMIFATNSSAANVKIINEYVRAVPEISRNSAGYMTLINKDSQTIRLQSVDTDLAAKTEIHGHTMNDGMMKMFKVTDGLELPPGKPVKLESGGYHIMLMGLKKELKIKDKVDMTLHFSDGDAVDIKIPVKSLEEKGHVQLTHGSVRATTPGMTSSAAYFTIHNGDKKPVRLTKIKSSIARKSELHTTIMKDGMMRMQKVSDLDIPEGDKVVLKPGGYHVMLMGLRKQIQLGDHVPVTLSFSNGDTVTIEAMAMKEIKGESMAH